LQKKTEISEDYFSENIDFAYSLFHGKFFYEQKNRSLLKLRKNIHWSNDDLKDFWKNHVSYKFVKPRNREYLIAWLKSMFFNRSFVEAYTKSNRTKMSMRLSTFVKNKIIKLYIKSVELYEKYQNENEFYSIKDYMVEIEEMMNSIDVNFNAQDDIQLLKIITKCDPTYSAIYTVLKSIKIEEIREINTLPIQLAIKTPIKIGAYDIINSPEALLQYLFNRSDFEKDKRRSISQYSMEKDLDLIRDRIPKFDLENVDTMFVLSVYNDLSIAKEKQIITMGYSRTSVTLFDQIKDILVYNYLPFKTCTVILHKLLHVIDPYTGKTLYLRGQKVSVNIHQQCIENLCLIFVYLKLKLNMTIDDIRTIFDDFVFFLMKKIMSN